MAGRLAGMALTGLGSKALSLLGRAYDTPLGRGAAEVAQGTGFGMVFGLPLAQSGTAALGGTLGVSGGAALGRVIAGEAGEAVGGLVGSGLGAIGGQMAATQLFPVEPQVDVPSSASSNHDKNEVNVMGAYSQPLTKDDVILQQQKSRLAQAQYAMQQYTTPPMMSQYQQQQ